MMKNCQLILPLAVFVIQTNGFSTVTPLTRSTNAFDSPSHLINSRLDRTCLFQEPFKIRMPWDPPEPQLQQERVQGEETAERKPRQRQPRGSPSYDLYGGSVIDRDEQLQDNSEVHDRSSVSQIESTTNERHAITDGQSNHQAKLAILLIDHGSKRQTSNDALHSIADRYESMLLQRLSASNPNQLLAVKACHMEIATPSIESALTSLIEDGATKIVCLPYFLSRGRHISMDVPNLIEDAKEALEENGMLDGVKVLMSKHLGSDVDSMLEVIDDLVKSVLNSDNDIVWMMENDDVAMSEGEVQTKDSLPAELRKYTNRAAILENMLEKKVQQLKTMTNRVAILEDVLNKKLEENDMLKQRLRPANVGGKCPSQEVNQDLDPKVVANLTSAIDALKDEKSELLNQLGIVKTQKIQVENDYNKTISGLTDKVSFLTEEVIKQNKTNTMLQRDIVDAQKRKHDNEQIIKIKEQAISDLQSQLAELLDAYNELEQLQNETEAAVVSYQNHLKDAQQENDVLIDEQCSISAEYDRKLENTQKLLEDEKIKTERMLEQSRKEYEDLLAQEQAVSTEWKDKHDCLVVELSKKVQKNVTSDSRSEELAKLKHELQEALDVNFNASSKIEELEKELLRQEDNMVDKEMEKQLKQQQQLQEYLKGQIQTYYETIQDQSSDINKYRKQIECMQKDHEEAMLIATNSVESSQRRETDLLNNIDELEEELNGLLVIDKETSSLRQSKVDAEEQNKQLTGEIEKLRCELDALSAENLQISDEKLKFERIILDHVLGQDRSPISITRKTKPKKRSRWRYLLRPWTVLSR